MQFQASDLWVPIRWLLAPSLRKANSRFTTFRNGRVLTKHSKSYLNRWLPGPLQRPQISMDSTCCQCANSAPYSSEPRTGTHEHGRKPMFAPCFILLQWKHSHLEGMKLPIELSLRASGHSAEHVVLHLCPSSLSWVSALRGRKAQHPVACTLMTLLFRDS